VSRQVEPRVKFRDNSLLFNYGVARVWVPPRGLIYSFFIHVIVFFSLAFSAPLEQLLFPVHVQTPAQLMATNHEVLVLPDLGGGSEGSNGGHAGSGGAPKRLNSGKSGGGRPAGMVYQGPQPIVSNPPKPDNLVQTIRQPDLASPPKLPFPIPAPNVMLLASRPVMPVLEKPPVPPPPSTTALQPKMLQPAFHPQALPPQVIAIAPQPPRPPQMDPPKLALPASAIDPVLAHPTTAKPTLAAKAVSAPAQTHNTESSGTDQRNLLVINAINLPINGRPLNIPPAEASGSFAVVADARGLSSGAAGDTAGIGHGDGANGGSGRGIGSGSGGNGGTGTGGGTGNGPGAGVGTGTGNGTGSGTGTGTGSGPGKGGAGNGNGSGTGHGTGTGPGSGPGVGPGAGPFRDVGIRGGGSATGVLAGGAASPSIPSNPARQYGYGMTIVASGASGGGLRDFGVFRNEAVYTVFLPADPETRGPQWVLQYASTGAVTPSQSHGILTPPYPLSRRTPHFPTEVVLRNAGRQMVIYAVINPSGKLESARILESPNPLLNQPLMDAIAEWFFKPAEFNGQPVGVRILLGVPLAPAMPF
jgi:TonB-like protein